MDTKTAFVSGHISVTNEFFESSYRPFLDYAMEQKHHFIVGDAYGIDLMTQTYLHEHGYTNVKVYHMFTYPRNNPYNYDSVGGFQSDSERDKSMTNHSDYDIAYIQNGRTNSGTERNIKRRLQKIKKEQTVCVPCFHFKGLFEKEISQEQLLNVFDLINNDKKYMEEIFDETQIDKGVLSAIFLILMSRQLAEMELHIFHGKEHLIEKRNVTEGLLKTASVFCDTCQKEVNAVDLLYDFYIKSGKILVA